MLEGGGRQGQRHCKHSHQVGGWAATVLPGDIAGSSSDGVAGSSGDGVAGSSSDGIARTSGGVARTSGGVARTSGDVTGTPGDGEGRRWRPPCDVTRAAGPPRDVAGSASGNINVAGRRVDDDVAGPARDVAGPASAYGESFRAPVSLRSELETRDSPSNNSRNS